MWTSSRGEISVQRKWWKWWNEFRACTCYNQLQKYLRHCTVFWHKSPVHDPVLVIPPPPLKVASNIRPYSKLGGTTLNGREEGVQYYILPTCDQERFEARKVVFPWECLNIFATGCSYSLPKWQAVKLTFFSPWGKLSFEFPFIDLIHPPPPSLPPSKHSPDQGLHCRH